MKQGQPQLGKTKI